MNLLPSPWVALAFVLAVGGAYIAGEVNGDEEGAARVQQAWDKSDKILSDIRARRIEANRKAEQVLQEKADEERNKRDAEKKRLSNELDAAVRELRHRPARPGGLKPSDVPAPAGAAGEVRGSTGAELYRDDAEFLTRKAHVAQLIRVDRDTCYRLYNEAREKLNPSAP